MGDMAPAYPDSARVSEYFRNFVYIRPNVWVVADEFAFETASAVDMYFHSDYAFTPDGGAGQFSVTGPRGKLFVTRLSPGSDSAFLQPIRHTSGSYNDTIPALRVRHTGLTSGTHFTLLETTAASGTRQAWATVSDTGASPMLVVGTGTDTLRFAVVRNRADRNSPLLVDPSGVSRRPGTPGRGVALRVLQSRSTVRFVIGGNSGDTYRVAVYDVRGRVVWQAATTGGKAICWRFQDGRRPGAGRYVVRVTGSGVLADGWVSAY